MNTDIKNETNEPTIWSRALYMLIFFFCLWLAKFVTYLVVAFQFFTVLFTGSTNAKLLKFGKSLSSYIYQVMRFLTFNTEEHPYPLGDWPDAE